jgi:hypothetical protein
MKSEKGVKGERKKIERRAEGELKDREKRGRRRRVKEELSSPSFFSLF